MRNERPTTLGDVDPATVDAGSAPKPKPKRRRRKVQPMPKLLEPWAEKARERMKQRPASPGILMEHAGEYDDFVPVPPHDNAEVWQLQIHDAFATRSWSTVRVFIAQLRALCGQHWSESEGMWRPSETELNAALNFVNSIQPKNEAEAALAAQMVAVHLMTMRMSVEALHLRDPRTASVAGKLARTYAMQLDTLNRSRGKARSTRQHITVKQEKHIHTHAHQHVAAWGCAHNQPPPSCIDGTAHVGHIEARTEVVGGRSALPGQDQIESAVPIAGREGEAGLPDARRTVPGGAKG